MIFNISSSNLGNKYRISFICRVLVSSEIMWWKDRNAGCLFRARLCGGKIEMQGACREREMEDATLRMKMQHISSEFVWVAGQIVHDALMGRANCGRICAGAWRGRGSRARSWAGARTAPPELRVGAVHGRGLCAMSWGAGLRSDPR